MGTRDQDRPARNPYDPLKRDLPSEAPGSRAAQRHYPRRDDRIRDDIAEGLYRSARLEAGEVSVDVNGGIVTLEGSVPERRMKHEIENLAAGIRGVKDVENRVRVSRDAAAAASGWEGAPSQRAIRGRTDADDIRGRPGTPEHEESLLDEGIEESFPASDTPSAVQPGSLAAEELSQRGR